MNNDYYDYLSDGSKSFVRPTVSCFILLMMLFFTACGRAEVIVTEKQQAVSEDIACESENSVSGNEETARAYVYICGAVEAPGVYEVGPECRLFEAVEMAGGLLEEADINACNLAQIVEDGKQYRIPAVGEVTADEEDGSYTSDGLLNINKATAEELADLPGIGATRAEAVVSYREENGDFASPEDIKKVRGIGDATYNGFKGSITVR
ncbi:MAG: helix-hairpin-helix domain-containing protein [Lachnospiraceae bacterium]|nr:helix-hairpin-helix domain-containing protein [Lachnospiraceae bacterium]